MENIKKFLQSLQQRSLNKYWLVCAILIIGVARNQINQGIFVVYIIMHSIILQQAYISYLEDKKRLETEMFEKTLKELIDHMNTKMNVTINRWINLGDKK